MNSGSKNFDSNYFQAMQKSMVPGRMNPQKEKNQMPNFKNLQFILEYIKSNPGCTVKSVRDALCTKNSKFWTPGDWEGSYKGHYTWYFSRQNLSYCRPKMGYDYGYWFNASNKHGKAQLYLTEKGLQRLAAFESA